MARGFRHRSGLAIVVAAALGAGGVLVAAPPALAAGSPTVYVAPDGDDASAGTTPQSAVATLARAQEVVRSVKGDATGPVTVQVAEGTYSLSAPLQLGNEDSGTAAAPVRWIGQGKARIIGGRQLASAWVPTASDPTVLVTDVPAGIDFDELFVGGDRQVMARYPNYDEAAPRLEGTTTLATINGRAAAWSKPATGFVRAMHCNDWGSVSFTVNGYTAGALDLKFVGDNNRPQDCAIDELPMRTNLLMVENIREELDAPGEWFLDRDANKLYFKPPTGLDPSTATIETGELDELVTVTGASAADPVHDISFENLAFERTHRTLFNSAFENLSRGDWSVVRKGALRLTNARDVSVVGSSFTELGGNGVFMDAYGERNSVLNSRFDSNGATDVQVVGSPSAVRHYADNYFTTPAITDTAAGPQDENYQRDISIRNNVMTNNGRYEKQTSSVNISMALRVAVLGNSLSDSPRACLNFSDTTWGGHVIRDNDIFDCVRETGDNGSINAWGRSRFWKTGARNNTFASLASGVTFDGTTGDGTTQLTSAQARRMMALDTVEPILIDRNRFWHNGDWAVDLDDGSSRFVVTNNLLLKGGIKLRDGFERTIENNILVNGHTFEQVSYVNGGDIIRRNITLGDYPYKNTQNDPVTAAYDIDKNLFWNSGAPLNIITASGLTEKLSTNGTAINTASTWYAAGMDRTSVVAAPKWANTNPIDTYDFTVAADSPALGLGFVNFAMTGFGAVGGALPPKASFPPIAPPVPTETTQVENLMGAKVVSITTEAEKSSYAISDLKGLKFSSVPSGSAASAAGILADDLVRKINGVEVTEDSDSFWRVYNVVPAGADLRFDVRRGSTDAVVLLRKITTPEQLNNTSGVVFENLGTGPAARHWIWRHAATGGGGAWLSDIQGTQTLGDRWSVTFHGTGIDIISQINTDLGNVELTLDGAFYKTQTFYATSRQHQQTVVSISDLEPGVHTLSGTMRSGSYMLFDSWRTHPADPPLRAATGALKTAVVSPTDQAEIPVTVTFDQDVTGLDPADFVVENGAVSALQGSGRSHELVVTAAQDGPVTISLPADAVQGATGLGNVALAPLTVLVDLPDPLALELVAAEATESRVTFEVRMAGETAATQLRVDTMGDAVLGEAGATIQQVGGVRVLVLEPTAPGAATVTVTAQRGNEQVSQVVQLQVGGEGRDIFSGTDGIDVLIGGDGADRLYGLGGNDVLIGGGASDDLRGGDGDDVLVGGGAHDFVLGEAGRDLFVGSPQRDAWIDFDPSEDLAQA